MQPEKMKQLIAPALLLVVILALSACATAPAKSTSIADRAQERWDILLSGDIDGAYDYLSPGYRSSVSLDQYRRKLGTQRVQWTAAKYIDSQCSENACKVTISLEFSIFGALPGVQRYDGKQEIIENWVKVNDFWWLVPED